MTVETARSANQQRLPDFLGLGAPKCATTWIFRCLREHPEIYIPSVKEIGFFDFLSDIENRIPEYADYFKQAERGQTVGEIYPLYLGSERAVDRVRRHLPEAKLFVSLRNPVDQIYSFYWHMRRQNVFVGEDGHHFSLQEALEKKPDVIVPHALYGASLARWTAAFGKDRINVVLYDEIQDDPARIIRELFEFLEVDSEFLPASISTRGSDTRKGVSPRSPLLDRLHTFTYKSLNRFVYHPLKTKIGFVAAWKIKEKLKIRQAMQKVFMKDGYPDVTEAERHLILDIVGDDIIALECLIDRDLSHWRAGAKTNV